MAAINQVTRRKTYVGSKVIVGESCVSYSDNICSDRGPWEKISCYPLFFLKHDLKFWVSRDLPELWPEFMLAAFQILLNALSTIIGLLLQYI